MDPLLSHSPAIQILARLKVSAMVTPYPSPPSLSSPYDIMMTTNRGGCGLSLAPFSLHRAMSTSTSMLLVLPLKLVVRFLF